MSSRHSARVEQWELDALDRDHAAHVAAIDRETPRLKALCDTLALRADALRQESDRYHESCELTLLVEQLRLGLGHARNEITAPTAASILSRWGCLVVPGSSRLP